MTDTPAPEAPEGSPTQGSEPTPAPTPSSTPAPGSAPAPPGVNPLARDGLDLFIDGMARDIGEEHEDPWAAGAETLQRHLREAEAQREEERRQKEAEQGYRDRLTSALDEREAASALAAEADKKSPKARRLAVVRDAAARNARTVKWAAPTAVAVAIALVFVGVFVGRDNDDPNATFTSVVASVTSAGPSTTAALPPSTTGNPPVTSAVSPTSSVSPTTGAPQTTSTTQPVLTTTSATAPAGEDPVAGLWDFSAVAGAPGTGGHIANFTLVDGRVETDTGYTGTYEVIREGSEVRVEIVLTGELGGRVSHVWFHMRLKNGELRGTGEADALGSANESSTSTTRTTVKFQNEIVGTRIAG